MTISKENQSCDKSCASLQDQTKQDQIKPKAMVNKSW